VQIRAEGFEQWRIRRGPVRSRGGARDARVPRQTASGHDERARIVILGKMAQELLGLEFEKMLFCTRLQGELMIGNRKKEEAVDALHIC